MQPEAEQGVQSAAAAGKPATLASTVSRAVLAISASQLAVIAIGFVTSVAQARLLGAAGRGDVTRFSNAGALAVLYFGLGVNSAIIYFVASNRVDPRALARMLRRLYVVTVSMVALAASLAALSPLRRFLPHDLSIPGLIAAVCLYFALSQLSSWLGALHAARADFTPVNTAGVTVGLAAALGSTALLWSRPPWAGPAAIVALLVGLEALRAAIFTAFTVRRRRAQARGTAGASAAEVGAQLGMGQLLRYSLLTYAGEALQFLTYRFDMWVVDGFHGGAELGRYSLAVSLAQMVWIVPTAAARVLFPYAAMLAPREAAALAWRTARVATLIAAGAAAVGAGCAYLFVTALFGDDFADVPALLGVLLLGVVPYSMSRVLGNYLAGVNALGVNVVLGVVGLALTVALDFALIPRYGASGAAWATAISYAVYTLLVMLVALRLTRAAQRAPADKPR